ncbi:FAD-dependent monooxygenase [Planctomonas deserti]|uniref:FAD-dependent monooxygenase n=1 Tax=Planctomonas deserti TaxID=2144185 RepID=UPI00197B6F2B|nr:FAD-dependent monooxygenase [Planctomonas deserti]
MDGGAMNGGGMDDDEGPRRGTDEQQSPGADGQDATTRETEVLVVGAGPTGLMLATVLARLGVDCLLVDGKAEPTRESRALGVHARTMEVYEQLGVVDRVLREGTPAQALAPGYGGRIFGRLRLGDIGSDVSPYPRIHVLEQSRNERMLADAYEGLGGEILWRHGLDRLDVVRGDGDGGTGVVAHLAGPAGAVGVRARYCVGADGASSPVRKSTDIRFEGITNRHTFYVADGVGVRGLAEDAINVRPGPQDFLLTFPMGDGGRARVLGIVRDADTPQGGLTEAGVRARLERLFSVTMESAAWFSTYRVHHRVASAFRSGPVFLAGDAAHVHSPVGAQGMNTGLQDAHNLATKLADVLRRGAPDSYLDRYEAERRPVARTLVRSTDRVFAVVTSDRRIALILRRVVPAIAAPVAVRLLPRLRGSGRFFQYLAQVRIHYWMSDEAKRASGGKRGRVVGRRLPWTGENYAPLTSFRWQVHAYGAVPADVLDRIRDSLPLEVHALALRGNTPLEDGMLYLVRPDGFVAASATPERAAADFAAALPFPVPVRG